MTYTPKVGDRVTSPQWPDGWWVDVEYVGRKSFIGVLEDGEEYSGWVAAPWQLVERIDPLRDMWINVYGDQGCYYSYRTREAADRNAMPGRTALLHIWTDSDGVDRIERVPLDGDAS